MTGERMSLEIAASIRAGERRVRERRWRRGLSVLLIAGLILATQVFAAALLRPLAHLYVFDGAAWTEIPLPEGEAPFQAISAADGSLWVTTYSDCGFLRYRDGAWSACQGNFDTQTSLMYNTSLITAHADNIWAIRDSSVVHYDGEKWMNYSQVLPTYGPGDIEASQHGVFVSTWYGNLSIFDGSNWTTTSITTLLPNITPATYGANTSLAKTTDGTIYASYNGALARYDGTAWTMIPLPANTPINQVYAGTETMLWVTAGNQLGTINLRGTPRFTPRAVNQAFNYPGAFVLADGIPTIYNFNGIFQWRAGNWRALPDESTTFSNARSGALTANADGSLWLVSTETWIYDTLLETRRDLGLFFRYSWWIIALIGIAALPFIHPGAERQGRAAQRQVWAARFDVPDLVTTRVGGGFYRVWSPVVVIGFLAAFILFMWGEFEDLIALKLLALLVLLLGLALPILIRWRGYVPARRSFYTEDYALRLSHRLLLALVIGVALYFAAVPTWERFTVSDFFGLILLVGLALLLAWATQTLGYSRAVFVAARQVEQNSDAAEQYLRRIERWLPLQSECRVLRADLADRRGDLDRAGWLYFLSVCEYQTQPRPLHSCLIKLADTLARRNCPEQALPLLECAARITPDSGIAYRKLAEITPEPERARALNAAAAQFGG